jgi:hypothetical protein
MMILLADQEIEDGRQNQAETLIDAAFAAYDQHAVIVQEPSKR